MEEIYVALCLIRAAKRKILINLIYHYRILINLIYHRKASRGAVAHSVTVKPTGCGMERSVLTLGSLCLPCYVRDTA